MGFVSPCLRAVAGAWVLAVLALSGCAESNEQVARTEPTIPRAVADGLAHRAEEIARLLAEGDTCAAASKAHDLRREAQQAIEKGEIPEPLRAPIESAVADLQKIECTNRHGNERHGNGNRDHSAYPNHGDYDDCANHKPDYDDGSRHHNERGHTDVKQRLTALKAPQTRARMSSR
jgi:hypothetical protein